MKTPDLQIAADDRPLFRPGKRPMRWGFPLLLGALIAAAGTIYYLWHLRVEPQQPAVPAAAKPSLTPQPSAEPRIEHPIEAAAAPGAAPLPALAESDSALHDALAAVFGSAVFDQFFHP